MLDLFCNCRKVAIGGALAGFQLPVAGRAKLLDGNLQAVLPGFSGYSKIFGNQTAIQR
jgi:hypothetical protein